MVERPASHGDIERRALERAEGGGAGDATPEGLERLPRALPPSLGVAGGEHRGVHRAGGGAGDGLDLEPGFLKQAVEHAPGIGAVAAAALQGEVNEQRFPGRLGGDRLPSHGVGTPLFQWSRESSWKPAVPSTRI